MERAGSRTRTAEVIQAVLIVAVVAVGIWFRFYAVDRKLYWHDEVWTSIRLAGHTSEEFSADVASRPVIHPSDFLAETFPRQPASVQRNVGVGLADNPHHAPLYYSLTSIWSALFGTSVFALRMLSVLTGLLALPAMFWLCREMFPERSVAWMGVLLLVTSPFHIRYAQEARAYSLWTLFIVMSNASLLLAVRRGTFGSWLLYSALTLLSVATSALHPLVCVAQGIFMLYRWQRDGLTLRLGREQIAFGGALMLAALPLLPWAWNAYQNRSVAEGSMAWVTTVASPLEMIRGWMQTLTFPFVGFAGQEWLYPIVPKPLAYAISAAVLLLMAWGMLTLWQRARRDVAILIYGLIALPLLFMGVPDLLWGGTRSAVVRYLCPVWVGLGVAMAYQLGCYLQESSQRARLWAGIAALLLVGSVTSDALLSTNRGTGKPFAGYTGDGAYEAAARINASPNPYVVVEQLHGSNTQLGDSVALSLLLDERVTFIISPDPAVALDLSRRADVFVLGPTAAYAEELSRSATLEDVTPYRGMVRIRPNG